MNFVIFFIFLLLNMLYANNDNINKEFIEGQNKILQKSKQKVLKYKILLDNKKSKREILQILYGNNRDKNNEKEYWDNLLKRLNNINNKLDKSIFFNSVEISKMKKKISELIKYVKKRKKYKIYFLYFASETVPKNSIANFLLSVDILRQNHFDVSSKIFFIGPLNDFKDYMFSWKDFISNKYPYPKAIINNFELKINPYFFEAYKIKKVPVMALAVCKNIQYIGYNDCSIKYLIRGDTSLEYFLFLISQANKNFGQMYRTLLTNKFRGKEHE